MDHKGSFVLNEELKEKAEKLIGIKGYYTNIPESVLSNVQEAHIQDMLTRKRITLHTDIMDFNESKLAQILRPH